VAARTNPGELWLMREFDANDWTREVRHVTRTTLTRRSEVKVRAGGLVNGIAIDTIYTPAAFYQVHAGHVVASSLPHAPDATMPCIRIREDE
jgi:hypothetical protein